jgi:uncharacterized protein (TIGR02453 family)
VTGGGFRGFPPEAITFYEGLEADNSKGYWTAHKDVYEAAVKGPMEQLVASVDERFRPLRIFRPYRDVRFAKDKAPYKTNIGASGEREGGAGYYVALSAEGLMAAAGYYHMANDQLDRFREAVDDESTGSEIAGLVAGLVAGGHVVGAHGELKTAPRGYARDHPRIDLLRRKGLMIWRSWPPAKWLSTAKAKDRVEEVWRAADPLNDWLDAHVGPSELAPEDGDF